MHFHRKVDAAGQQPWTTGRVPVTPETHLAERTSTAAARTVSRGADWKNPPTTQTSRPSTDPLEPHRRAAPTATGDATSPAHRAESLAWKAVR